MLEPCLTDWSKHECSNDIVKLSRNELEVLKLLEEKTVLIHTENSVWVLKTDNIKVAITS